MYRQVDVSPQTWSSSFCEIDFMCHTSSSHQGELSLALMMENNIFKNARTLYFSGSRSLTFGGLGIVPVVLLISLWMIGFFY